MKKFKLLNETYDTDIVAEILSGYIKQPSNFKWLSNNGTAGEVRYRGIDYAFRKRPDGSYKVMRSSDAGWNWSETLYKDESLNKRKINEAVTDDLKKRLAMRLASEMIDVIDNFEKRFGVELDIEDVEDAVADVMENAIPNFMR